MCFIGRKFGGYSALVDAHCFVYTRTRIFSARQWRIIYVRAGAIFFLDFSRLIFYIAVRTKKIGLSVMGDKVPKIERVRILTGDG